MWIMLRTKLPTIVSPPKMSLFFATPWPDARFVQSQERRLKARRALGWMEQADETDEGGEAIVVGDLIHNGFGWEHRWDGAVKIVYKREEIRVFPHEYSIVSNEHMAEYINSGDYTLTPDGVADEQVLEGILNGETKPIYEAALLEGCTHHEAMLMAMGITPESINTEVPPIGWYKCNPKVAAAFCYKHEMEETDRREDPAMKPAKKPKRERSYTHRESYLDY